MEPEQVQKAESTAANVAVIDEQVTAPITVEWINPLIPNGIENLQLRCVICGEFVPAKRATSRSKFTCSPECRAVLLQFQKYQLQKKCCPACYHPSTPQEREEFKKWRKARGDVREKRGNPQKTRKKKVEDSENEKGNEV